MNIIKAIRAAEQKQKDRNYDYIYWCVDVHGVILTPTYDLNNKGATFYPYCLDTLGLLTDLIEHKIILWTSSHDVAIESVVKQLEQEDIKIDFINHNPQYTKTDLCDFTKKFYFDILLDDKAGFEAETDWKHIYDYLTSPRFLI